MFQHVEELVPAYVLDALESRERQTVETHLRQCPTCSQLVAEYQPVTNLLPYAAPSAEPSPDLRYRVLAATMPNHRSASSPVLAAFNGLALWVAQLFRSPAFSAGALMLAIALGVWNISLQNQLAAQTALQTETNNRLIAELSRERAALSVMAYGEGQPRQLKGTEIAARSTGRLYGKADQKNLLFVVHGLPKTEAGKVYQVWLIDANGDRTNGGLFTVGDDGYGWTVINSPKPISEYQSIGVTEEPSGGSPKPTGPKVMGTTS